MRFVMSSSVSTQRRMTENLSTGGGLTKCLYSWTILPYMM